MYLPARLDEIGKPVWIGLMVLGFILFWPVGLALLAFLIWSGRMSCWHHEGAEDWRRRMMERMERRAERHWHRHGHGCRRSTGNRAFDEYRAETIRRLEEEEREFRDFLDRLRFARDKAEFDQFLNERRNRSEAPETPPPA